MQIRSKAYLQLISFWRSCRGLIPAPDSDTPARTSPLLLYTAIVLASLVAMLEINLHRSELEAIGLVSKVSLAKPVFTGP